MTACSYGRNMRIGCVECPRFYSTPEYCIVVRLGVEQRASI